ncbi:hypothetical protein Tco_1007250 [Tanacetum coccineum]
MQKEKEQQDKLNAVKARLLYGNETRKIKEIMKSRITPNPRRQPPEQSQTGGMEIGAPEARHRFQCWEEKNEVHPGTYLTTRHQGSHKKENRGATKEDHHRGTSPRKLATFKREDRREVTVSPTQETRGQTPTRYLFSLGTCEERNPFTPRIWNFQFPKARCPATSRHKMEGDPEII